MSKTVEYAGNNESVRNPKIKDQQMKMNQFRACDA